MKHKSFIVPHDFTPVATIALNHAIETSKRVNTTIHILHVVEKQGDIDAATNKIDELIAVLYEDGYITSESILKNNNDLSVHDEMFMEYLTKISKSRHLLTKSEEEIIKSIADRL